jgi:hypothetical protein
VFKLSQFITVLAELTFTVVVLPAWVTPAEPATTSGLLGAASTTCAGAMNAMKNAKKHDTTRLQ